MKYFISTKIILLIVFLSFTVFAQKKDKVEVSPNLTPASVVRECKKLDLGTVVFYHKPIYPEEAKAARVGGNVRVEILVDIKGNVIEVLNLDGHKLLQEASKKAALKAKFTPTICDGKVVQIKTLIFYDFIPNVMSENYFTPKYIEEFVDINSESDYYESILFITENYKLAFGYGDKKFHPDAPLTKGDFSHFVLLTLDLLKKRAKLVNKVPKEINLYKSFNPQNITNTDQIKIVKARVPYSESVNLLFTDYEIAMLDQDKKFNGKFPITYNEVIDYWQKIFGKDTIPVHFKKLKTGDRIFTRGEFSLYLQESLFVLTYKVLP